MSRKFFYVDTPSPPAHFGERHVVLPYVACFTSLHFYCCSILLLLCSVVVFCCFHFDFNSLIFIVYVFDMVSKLH